MARTCVLILLVAALPVAAAGCGGGDSPDPSSSGSGQVAAGSQALLPEGGSVPPAEITDLDEAATAAECELQDTEATSNEHTSDIEKRIPYPTNPPTAGKHFQAPAEDGIYDKGAPPDVTLVHSHEHGRIVIWFKPDLPEKTRAGLRALVEEDDYQMLLVPRANMPFEVAATAWNAEPGEYGTGRLLGCRSFTAAAYDALRAFRDEHRGKGPETVP